MDLKFRFGPLRVGYGPGRQWTPSQKRVQTRSGFRLVHSPRPKKHRVTIYNPRGHLIAKLNLNEQEWREFIG